MVNTLTVTIRMFISRQMQSVFLEMGSHLYNSENLISKITNKAEHHRRHSLLDLDITHRNIGGLEQTGIIWIIIIWILRLFLDLKVLYKTVILVRRTHLLMTLNLEDCWLQTNYLLLTLSMQTLVNLG
ncbi:hypothetical protein D3C86_1797130 [compost metagenome]